MTPNELMCLEAIRSAEGRFWDYVEVRASGACWPWKGHVSGNGYARMGVGGKAFQAHRLAYFYCVGPIPDGLVVDHQCNRRDCVNPNHLRAMTHEENVRRPALARTTCPNGHRFTDSNTYIDGRGARVCRICKQKNLTSTRRSKNQHLRRFTDEQEIAIAREHAEGKGSYRSLAKKHGTTMRTITKAIKMGRLALLPPPPSPREEDGE